MLVMSPDEMDSNVIGIAAMFYILADLDVTIQRENKAFWLSSVILINKMPDLF